MCQILDANYEKYDLRKVRTESEHLTEEESAELHNLLIKYEFFFDGNLLTWETKPIDIELQPDSNTFHTKL